MCHVLRVTRQLPTPGDVRIVVAGPEEHSLLGALEHRFPPRLGLGFSHGSRLWKESYKRLHTRCPELGFADIGDDMLKGGHELEIGIAQESRHLSHYAGIGDNGIDNRLIIRLSLLNIIATEGQ